MKQPDFRSSTPPTHNSNKVRPNIHVITRSNHHNYPGKGGVHNDNTAGTVADLEALDTLQRNTLGTHAVDPVVGILDTLEVVVVVGTLRVVVVGTLRMVVAEALMAGTLEESRDHEGLSGNS